jgi:Caspase domain
MSLPDPFASRAVLIGASAYETLEPLPAVANNIEHLRALLTEPDLWGLPPENLTVLLNEPRDAVLDGLHDAAVAATDAILVYFAGHGLLEQASSALHLALPRAALNRMHPALRYAELRREVTTTCRARSKVVILDCCFSGRAMQGFMSATAEIADQAQIDGAYLMTSSAENSLALAAPGERFTAFTGDLLHVIETGVPDGPDLLDMSILYSQTRASLVARNRPEPQERARNAGGSITLVRNRRGQGVSGHAGEVRAYSRLSDDLEQLLRRPPREVLERAAELREAGNGDTADLLLAALGASWPDQAVAATLRLLRQGGREDELEIVLDAVADRPPGEVAETLSALHRLGSTDFIHALMEILARKPAAAIAAITAASGRPGSPRDGVTELLDAAIKLNPDIRFIGALATAFWAAGQDKFARSTLRHSALILSEDDVVSLLDVLCAGPYHDVALRFCRAAVVRQDAVSVARLVDELTDLGRPVDADLLLEWLGSQPPAHAVPHIKSLFAQGRTRDAERILEAARAVSTAKYAEHIVYLFFESTSPTMRDVVATFLERHPEQSAELIDRRLLDPNGMQLAAAMFALMHGSVVEAEPLCERLASDDEVELADLVIAQQLEKVTDVASAVRLAKIFGDRGMGPWIDRQLPKSLSAGAAPGGHELVAIAGFVFPGVRPWGISDNEIGKRLSAPLTVDFIWVLRDYGQEPIRRLLGSMARHRSEKKLEILMNKLMKAGLFIESALLEKLVRSLRGR